MMRHFLTFGIVILVLGGCAKEKEMEVAIPKWGSFCFIMGNTLSANRYMIGMADSTRCLFYINDHLKQDGKSGLFQYEIVKGDSLLIYKSYAFLSNYTWVDLDTLRIKYYEPEKIIVHIGEEDN